LSLASSFFFLIFFFLLFRTSLAQNVPEANHSEGWALEQEASGATRRQSRSQEGREGEEEEEEEETKDQQHATRCG
jgi:hypothetical protein